MWYTKSISETESKLRTNINYGLDEKDAKSRLEKYGENKLKENKKENIFVKFIKQFNDFMIIILIIASIVSAFIAKIDGSGDYIDSIIIIAIVVFNSIMGLIQEEKAEKSLEALKKLSAPVAKVRRNGKVFTIDSNNVVPGDILILESGMYVPADARLISSYNLKVEESALTGENIPVLKDCNCILKENIPTGDMINMVFATSIIVNGHGEAIVTDTGMNTKVGKIANMIISDESPETPIQKKLGEVGKTLGIACLIICIIIFIIGLFKKIPPIEMFMTSVGLAVAAIPEGLPAIVTILLSIGVTKMSKKNTIIRKLPAVETLGSSSVICSDKTGTLTQNKMKVVEIYDINGKVINLSTKKFILKHASMCTDTIIENSNNKLMGVGEPTEVAIVNAALDIGENKNELSPKINEIPFDSTRKLMTTIHKENGKYKIITKGAPDVLLKKCSSYYSNNTSFSLNSNNITIVNNQNNLMANKSLRVIAVAYKELDTLPSKIDSKNIENNLIFIRINRYD